ncbi:hypothetical protein CEXT_676871 [Caerostris extrusa]|uniref:Uncharacterized protein n=1 Tax=Caerostris extrusa TaxID=172846 RepID=A0AAV4VAB3_CAEEX|nr:hypothetical protein CEXT_676871 [Caerostris extrusa]
MNQSPEAPRYEFYPSSSSGVPLSDHSFSFSRKTKVLEFLSPDLTLLADGYETGPAAHRNTTFRTYGVIWTDQEVIAALGSLEPIAIIKGAIVASSVLADIQVIKWMIEAAGPLEKV